MDNQQLECILTSYREERLSHAFLIETNNQEQCLKDLKKILCEINCEQEYVQDCFKCNLCHLIELENLPSLIIVRPDGQNIRKEQVLDLKKKFSTIPIYSKYNMYIFMASERLNASSSNTILKFLEEPENGILGFFITNNKENIIETIKSRCQILVQLYDEKDSNEEVNQIAIQLISEVHLSKEMALLFNKSILTNDFSKELCQKVFQKMIEIYYYFYKSQFYEQDNNLYSELNFLFKKSSDLLLEQIQLVQLLEKELNYNVNLNLLLDLFVLETR